MVVLRGIAFWSLSSLAPMVIEYSRRPLSRLLISIETIRSVAGSGTVLQQRAWHDADIGEFVDVRVRHRREARRCAMATRRRADSRWRHIGAVRLLLLSLRLRLLRRYLAHSLVCLFVYQCVMNDCLIFFNSSTC
jgi:hypothetical protein